MRPAGRARANRRNPRERPPVDTDLVRVRVATKDLRAVDRFAKSESDKPSRTEAVRRILRDWLVAHGYLKVEPEE